MQEENSSSVLSVCPSFNSYSSNNRLAEVAAKVSEGFSRESETILDVLPPPLESSREREEDEEEDEEEFEFALVRPDPDSFSLPAGKVFYDGQIRPIFPIFNRDLLLDGGDHEIHDRELNSTHDRDLSSIRVPLKNLFIDEREVPSSSSSESDELERIPPGTYCVWSPKAVEASPGRCKKSNSTGSSSKRWRFRDLLRRSNSDGKDSFVFLTPSTTNNTGKKREEKTDQKVEKSKETKNSGEVKVAGKAKAKGVTGEKLSAHEIFYVRNRAMKEGDKKRSYLPYRKDLVGFFANVNGLSKNFPPF